MLVWARQQLQLLTLQHLEEMTAFASISAEVKVLLEISAKISFHLLVLTLSTSWVRSFCADCFRMCWNPERNLALQCLLSIPNLYPTHLISEAIRAAQKDISLLKNMILTRFDCMDGAIIQLVASVSEVSSAREALHSAGFSDLFKLVYSFNKKQSPLYARLAKKNEIVMQKARKVKPLVASH